MTSRGRDDEDVSFAFLWVNLYASEHSTGHWK